MTDFKQPISLAEAIGEFSAELHPAHFDLSQAAALNAMYDRELRQAFETAEASAEKVRAAFAQLSQGLESGAVCTCGCTCALRISHQ